ncbi:MAG: nucleoside phosphorylase [Eubacterium sp.]|nr:nucleoside phosphorylase [Eubacterium sp.]
MWKFKEDNTSAVITAEKHIQSCRKNGCPQLPKTAILFYMYGGVDYLKKHYKSKLIAECFPSFLNSRPIYKLKNYDVCFLQGGWGAPMAVDTIETLYALGVKNVVSVGMFGAFSEKVNSGDIVIPDQAFSEEGTSLHYYENREAFYPNRELHDLALKHIEESASFPIVSTDAVYRQTFYKEQLWRNKGAVGVDMETSALFSVSEYLGMNTVSILIASDKHPLDEKDTAWKWTMTKQMRYDFFEKCIGFAMGISL